MTRGPIGDGATPADRAGAPDAGSSATDGSPDWAALDRYVDASLERWTNELLELLAIPSEGGDPDALRAAAAWVADRLGRLGATVEVLELPDTPPLVVGEIGVGPRTLSAVQHYDVQPAAPLELWTSHPYQPAVRDGRVWGRGATDNKGEMLPRLWAAEAWLATIGPLPCRIRFLVEGEEEVGSSALDELLDLRPSLRLADAALIEGGGLDANDRAGIVGGGKGMVLVELSLRSLAHDAHSSLSVLLPNAGHRMAQALATLWDADGRPAVAGLDVGARPITGAQREVLEHIDLAELDEIRQEWGVTRFLGGLDGIAAEEAMAFQTTLNLQGLWAGHTEATPKTVTPAEAHARLDVRLVPDQDPEEVAAAIRRHLDGHGFADVELAIRESERAWWTPPDHPVVSAAAHASEAVTGIEASIGISMAGTVPMYQVCAAHHVPATSLGAGRDDARAHAPDENVHVDDLATATRITARFLDAFARLPEVPRVS